MVEKMPELTSLVLFCQCTFTIAFAWSAFGKLRNVSLFRDAVSSFQLLPAQWSPLIARSVLLGEVSVVVLLCTHGIFLTLGFLLAVLLLLIFSTALLLVLRRHMHVDCNCFGQSENRVSFYDLIRNTGLLLCGLLGLLSQSFFAQDNTASVSWSMLILVFFMATTFVTLLVNNAGIIETLRQSFKPQETL